MVVDDTIISAYMHLFQLRDGVRVRALSMVATSAILRGDFVTAERKFRSRRGNHKLTKYGWNYFVVNIMCAQDKDLHWTLGG